MMKAQKTSKVMALILSSAVLAIYGCGGGGGGGEEKTPATLTSSNAPTAAAGTIQALSLNGLSSIAATAAAGIDGKERSVQKGALREILDTTLSLVRNDGNGKLRAAALSGSNVTVNTQCTSGSMAINASWTNQRDTNGDGRTDDFENFSGSITFANCVEGSETFDGSESITVTGWLSAPTGITLTANMTFVDTKGTTTVTDDDNLTFTNLTMSLTGISRDQTTGEVISATMSITGTVSGMESGDPVNLGFDAFTLTFSRDASGETVSISGSLYVPCVGGWVTITTLTPVFTPAGSPCPTSGDIKITSGGNTVEVVFAAGCDVTVTFNGTGGFRNFTGLEGQCS